LGNLRLPQTTSSKTQTREEQIEPVDGISAKGTAWMKKNAITREQLEHVFCMKAIRLM